MSYDFRTSKKLRTKKILIFLLSLGTKILYLKAGTSWTKAKRLTLFWTVWFVEVIHLFFVCVFLAIILWVSAFCAEIRNACKIRKIITNDYGIKCN